MANLSQQKRQRMLEFLQTIREEHKDDDDVLIAIGEIESELNAKKYGLVWEQHEEAVDVQMRDNIPVFTECADKEIFAAPGEKFNFLLEGDNLHSLRLLEKTHLGKIDLIYIDPPYNTGNQDFRYDDVYVDELDTYRHSKWLSFMSERLRIAAKLLAPHGFIFISIDDKEAAQLKLLCDEIFGDANYEKTDYIQVRYPDKTLKSDMKYHKEIEQVLVYRKSDSATPYLQPQEYDYEKFVYSVNELAPGIEIQLGGKKVVVFQKGEWELVKHKEGFKEGLKEIWATGTILNGNSSGRFFRDYLDGRKEKDGLGVLYKVYGVGDDSFDYRYFSGPQKVTATKGKYYQGVPVDKMEEGSTKVLDFCYVYTFDEKYKAGLLADMDKAYETRRLFLKDKCKTFTLEKEIRDQDFDGLGEREVLNKIYEALVKKYGLSGDKANNKMRFMAAGYQFGDEIIGHALYGQYIRTDTVMESHNYYTTRKRVNTHKHGMDLLHCVDSIKSTIGMATAKVKTILERLFRKGGNSYRKLLSLDTTEFYAFIINNEHKLKEEFREVTSDMAVQMSLTLHPKKSQFHIPEQDFFKYDSGVKSEVEYLSNAYHEYTSGYATSLVRSTSEILFEQYCENQSDIEWVYKNGDTGQQYFSIVYIDALQHQWLFYADYIVMKKDGTVWVIETKGGESKGQDKNIDKQIENKFNAFKKYAEEKGLHWGFVRDKDNQLYINNTVFSKDMSDEHWIPLKQEF